MIPVFDNLIAFAVQSAVLLGLGLALPWLLRMRHPRWKVVWYQFVLAACLLLPVIEPWQRPVLRTVQVSTVLTDGVAVADSTAAGVDWEAVVPAVLAAGMAFRLAWFGLGMARLRRYRRSASPLQPLPEAIAKAEERTKASASWLIAPGIGGPVTFGFRSPVVLVPAGFASLTAESQTAIATHELIHVRRADWPAAIAEELAGALLWFQPLAWVLQDRLRLTREELVDREVVAITASPESYVAALLDSARGAVPDLAPGPAFFIRRGLARRVRSIYEEVPVMSAFRSTLASTGAIAFAAAALWVTAAKFPLIGAPQEAAQADRGIAQVDPQTRSELRYQHPVTYPMAARRAHVEGDVTLEATLNEDGTVADARVISGPEPLRRAALESVLEWHFVNESKTRRTVVTTLTFRLEADTRPASFTPIGKIDVGDDAGRARETIEARLAPYIGQPATPAIIHEIAGIVKPFGLSVGVATRAGEAAIVRVGAAAAPGEPAAPGTRIRVGGNVQAAKLTTKVPPVYPPLARTARIQGAVRFNVVIAPDGAVRSMQLIHGHPLLVDAAQQALARWVYEPTLLNGNPVEVVTVVDVNFTLSE
ncbi:MAG: M56 family metallopeptidase [Bryobacteraceae bacterium]